MKSMDVDPAIESNRELRFTVSHANEMLERILGPSSGLVSGTWSFSEEQGRPVLWLEIRDWSGSAAQEFSLEELRNPKQLELRLRHLWDDLLQTRSREEIKKMKALGPEHPRFMNGPEALDEIVEEISRFREREGSNPVKLKLPIRYAAALMKLREPLWEGSIQDIRHSGIDAFAGKTLYGVDVELVPGVEAELEVVGPSSKLADSPR